MPLAESFFTDRRALHAERLIHQLGVYDNIFGLQDVPAALSEPLPSQQQAEKMASLTVETLARVLPPITSSVDSARDMAAPKSSLYDRLHKQLQSSVDVKKDPDLHKRLYLAASISPMSGITYKEKSKTLWLGERFLRDGLSVFPTVLL